MNLRDIQRTHRKLPKLCVTRGIPQLQCRAESQLSSSPTSFLGVVGLYERTRERVIQNTKIERKILTRLLPKDKI